VFDYLNMKRISKENNNKNIKAPKKSLLMNIDKKKCERKL
jgi:hypothetical protein